jgi:hypothetical protein
MKNLIYLTIASFSLTFVSCRKERTCECTITSTTGAQTFTGSSSVKASYVTKRELKVASNCFSTKEVETDNGIQTTTTIDCKLK